MKQTATEIMFYRCNNQPDISKAKLCDAIDFSINCVCLFSLCKKDIFYITFKTVGQLNKKVTCLTTFGTKNMSYCERTRPMLRQKFDNLGASANNAVHLCFHYIS